MFFLITKTANNDICYSTLVLSFVVWFLFSLGKFPADYVYGYLRYNPLILLRTFFKYSL